MNQRRIIGAMLFVALVVELTASARTRDGLMQMTAKPLRVALIGFAGAATEQSAVALRAALANDARVALIEASQMQPALKAVGYTGSINLNTKEAQGIGAAIGCDFFIIGKTDAAMRSEAANESHAECVIGVMIVDSRSGALAHFDFILEKAASPKAAESQAAQTLAARTRLYVEKMNAFRAARELIPASSDEPVEELPDTESALAAGFKAPEFLSRVKPDYTEEASRADITATVEANVVFKANGEIGDIEIIRWAGFGLDEAAVRAIRQLKFKPATRNNKAINVRALLRYNFRRVNEK